MALHVFDLTSFQAACPALAATDPTALGLTFTNATFIMTPYDGCLLNGTSLQYALNLMTGHLTQIASMLAADPGAVIGPVSNATEGSVSLGLVPAPATSMWAYWLAATPYGLQLLALLSVKTAGGIMVGGSLERASFRQAGGIFPGRCF
jgi:hypothetical protein